MRIRTHRHSFIPFLTVYGNYPQLFFIKTQVIFSAVLNIKKLIFN